MFRSATLVLLAFFSTNVAGHGQMSRHLVTEDLSMVVVMADAETTQGPYYEEDSSYMNTNDLTEAATAGSTGVTEDRDSVLDGVPLELTMTVYDLSTSSEGYAEECGGVEVFLWHCDAIGVYSDVSKASQMTEDTTGQYWLRAYQTTARNGKVTFNTILPGWYTSRSIHYHVRLRYTGSTSWAATTQFLVNDTARSLFESIEPYASDTQQQTDLANDSIYNGLSSDVRDLLVLNMQGSVEAGFTAEMELGLGSSSSSALCTSDYDDTPAPTATDAPTVSDDGSSSSASPDISGAFQSLFGLILAYTVLAAML
eukprot:Nitzschia sp. Nitz4//scaffold180_size44305//39152//40087//NITZ4_007243-RA/size44305-processed-gene-0.46-mRNA-1//1//CDS//3329539479//3965//frame0